MARLLPIVVVLALLGGTAAAFVVTEGLKLEKSPISKTSRRRRSSRPTRGRTQTVPIAFRLRKPDRVTVEIVDGNGNVVRTLVRSRRGAERRPAVHLERTRRRRRGRARRRLPAARPPRGRHKTIVLPNPITIDATPPFIRLRLRRAARDLARRRLRQGPCPDQVPDERAARAQLYVDGEPRTLVSRFLRAGKIDVATGPRRLKPGKHRMRLRALDVAGNVGPPSRALRCSSRYIELPSARAARSKTGRRFGFRVAHRREALPVHLGSLHARRSGRAADPARAAHAGPLRAARRHEHGPHREGGRDGDAVSAERASAASSAASGSRCCSSRRSRVQRLAGLGAWALGCVLLAVYLAPHGPPAAARRGLRSSVLLAAVGRVRLRRWPFVLPFAVLACVAGADPRPCRRRPRRTCSCRCTRSSRPRRCCSRGSCCSGDRALARARAARVAARRVRRLDGTLAPLDAGPAPGRDRRCSSSICRSGCWRSSLARLRLEPR